MPFAPIPRTLRRRLYGWHRSAVRRLASSQLPPRLLEVRKDDTFLVSYPKSGNTWLRFLVANLLNPAEPADFETIDWRVPDIHKRSHKELASLDSPRFLKSHEYFDPHYPRVVYIARDPRDVAVSYYYHRIKRGFLPPDYPKAQFVEDYLAGRVARPETWYQSIRSWCSTLGGTSRFLFLRYEDLQRDPIREVRRLATFFGLSYGEDELSAVVEASSFRRMRMLEQRAKSAATFKNTRTDMPFVRSGRSGDWRSDLPEASIARIEDEWGDLMDELGYARSGASRTPAHGAVTERAQR